MPKRCATETVTIANVHDTGSADSLAVDWNLLLSCGCVTQPIEILLSTGRIMHGDWKLALVDRDAHDHPRQAKTMIAVEVADADPRNRCSRHASQGHLSLGALSRIEQHAVAVPAKQVTVVIAMSRRRLARSSQHDQFAFRHLNGLSRSVR